MQDVDYDEVGTNFAAFINIFLRKTNENPTIMREPFHEIQAAQIESVCTRFHNQLEYLCYRIVIRYTGQIMYRDFHNYQEYQHHHDMLIRAMHDKSTLPNIFRTVEMSR